MATFLFFLLLVLVIVCAGVVGAALKDGNDGEAVIAFSVIGAFILAFCLISGSVINVGDVGSESWLYSSYLDDGTVYEVHHVTNVGSDHIILVQEKDRDAFKAIRVTGPLPPQEFMLADGKPVAVKAQ